MKTFERTQVGIVGAGPAGLLLARMLEVAGIDTLVLENRSRSHIEQRQRAGILEQGTFELLERLGVGERIYREGAFHDGIELLVDGAPHRIDFRVLAGRRVALWPQTEIVKDLVAARVASGARLEFQVSDVAVARFDTSAPRLSFTDALGGRREVRCDFVAGCDGFHGTCRDAVPQRNLSIATRCYPFAWLGVTARVAPSSDELIYSSSAHGFALHSMRGPDITRLYIQCHPADEPGDWPDDRIWDELHKRLARENWSLREGPIVDKGITPIRSFVAAPLRHGRLLLAGDAAHIVPPTGAKGLNLAAADVEILAEGLIDFLRGRPEGLETYSERALRRVWRAEHFSWWMTSMLHRFPGSDAFDRGLQRAQLDYVCSSEAAKKTLAENYVGLPL